MSRRFFYLVTAALMLLLGAVMTSVNVETAPAAPAVALAPAQAAPNAPAPQAAPAADYVGSDTCLGCHDDATKLLATTPHWRATNPRTPAAAQGCETCHGPGQIGRASCRERV